MKFHSLIVHCATLLGLTILSVGCGSSGPKDYVPKAERFSLDGKAVPAQEGTLTVATFNLHGMATPQLLAEDVRQMPAVDVWIFQEVSLSAPGSPVEPTLDKLRALLPEGQWDGVVARVNPDDAGVAWEGQAILSRLPLGPADLWSFETSGPKRRRALVSTVQTSIGPVQIVNTDHEMSFLDPTYGSRKQVDGLVAKLRRSKEMPTIVGGDFNSAGNAFRMRTSTRDVDQIIDQMASAGFDPLPDRPNAVAAPTYKFLFAGVQLDHLFSRGLECVEWESPVANGSDHRAVWARYNLKQK